MPSIVLITAPPPCITPTDHRQLVASTPASFNDIPPVLRHKEQDLEVTIEPAIDGFSPEDSARGTLYVTENVLAFISDTGKGFQIEYLSITLHAISRDDAKPSVYCQLDESVKVPQDENFDGETFDTRELSLIPASPASLEPIFEALSICAALHPDQQESEDDMDDAFVDAAGDFETFTGDENQELSEVGRASLAYLESIIDNSIPQSRQDEKSPSKDSLDKVNGTG